MITIIDACNGDTVQSNVHYAKAKSLQSIQAKKAIQQRFDYNIGEDPEIYTTPEAIRAKKLLRQRAGEITITSSTPGQFSTATVNGSLFTNAFLAKAYEKINAGFTSDILWQELMEDVKSSLPDTCVPVWEIIPEYYRTYPGFKLDYEKQLVHLCTSLKSSKADSCLFTL